VPASNASQSPADMSILLDAREKQTLLRPLYTKACDKRTCDSGIIHPCSIPLGGRVAAHGLHPRSAPGKFRRGNCNVATGPLPQGFGTATIDAPIRANEDRATGDECR
jgi:hypothetical protein